MSHSSDTSGSEPAEGRIQAAVARRVDGVVIWIARHWLALFNSLVALYLLLPFLAPVLANAGLTTPASLLYSTYSATCHQLPERSYFLFGERPFYSLSALEASGLRKDRASFNDAPSAATTLPATRSRSVNGTWQFTVRSYWPACSSACCAAESARSA